MSMSPPPDAGLDALAASLGAESGDAKVFFRVLCQKLLDLLPGSTEVERRHSFFRWRRGARRVTVRIGEETFEAALQHGDVACRHVHSVLGVGEGLPWAKAVTVDEWLRALVATVGREAHASAEAAAALRSMVT